MAREVTLTRVYHFSIVQEVKLACTILTDEDGITITIPNKQIVGEILHNSKANKIVESIIGISYSSSPDTAIAVIQDTLKQFSDVTTTPKPQIGIQEFGESSVNIGVRYWIPTIKYYSVSYAVNLAIYKNLQKAGIEIPFPQRDVRIISQPVNAQTGHPV